MLYVAQKLGDKKELSRHEKLFYDKYITFATNTSGWGLPKFDDHNPQQNNSKNNMLLLKKRRAAGAEARSWMLIAIRIASAT